MLDMTCKKNLFHVKINVLECYIQYLLWIVVRQYHESVGKTLNDRKIVFVKVAFPYIDTV